MMQQGYGLRTISIVCMSKTTPNQRAIRRCREALALKLWFNYLRCRVGHFVAFKER